MFEIETNIEELVRKLKAIPTGALQEPVRNKGRWRSMMQRGTEGHFRKLGPGNRADASALGGRVFWPSARAAITRDTRLKLDVPPGPPFLRATDSMYQAFTSQAVLGINLGGNAVSLNYHSTNPSENRKALKHQLGGPHEALFAPLGVRMDDFPFPQRQFLYWDENMKEDALRFLVQGITRAVETA